MNTKKCFPILSLIALLSTPLGYVIGAQYCHRAIWNQVDSTVEYKSEDAKEDHERFAALGEYLCSVVFGVTGAAAGMVLSGLAHLRKEAWQWLRIVAFAGNVCIFGFGVIFYVFPFLF